MNQRVQTGRIGRVQWRLMAYCMVAVISGLLMGCATLKALVPGLPVPRLPGAETAATIQGQVLWGDAPQAGVRVELRDGAWADANNATEVAAAESATDGRYSLEAPEAGQFGLVALWPDGGANVAAVTPVDVVTGTVDADVYLARELVWLEPISGEEVGRTPSLRWEGLPDIVRYSLTVVDTGTTELIFDLEITQESAEDLAAEQRVALPPLTPEHTYTINVQGYDARGNLVAGRSGEFHVAPQSVEATGELPPACTMSGDPVYVDWERGFCFPYPAEFESRLTESGDPFLVGPALDDSAEPVRASLIVEVRPAAPDATLEGVVDHYLAGFDDALRAPIRRSPMMMAVQPAELLENVPGREGSTDVWMLGNGSSFHLMFMPLAEGYPQAEADMAKIFSLVTGSLSLLPLDGEGEAGSTPPVGGQASYTAVMIDELGLSLEVPAGWLHLEPDMIWTPSEGRGITLGVKVLDLAPPQEIEAAMLPASSVILSNQPLSAAWDAGRLVTVAVYGPDAEIVAVEAHALFIVTQDGARRAMDLYTVSPDEAQQIALQPVLQHALDTVAWVSR